MQHIMDRFDVIKLCVKESDSDAVRFYRNLGFEQEAVFENYYDVNEDALRLAWKK